MKFREVMTGAIGSGVSLPEPIDALFEWIDTQALARNLDGPDAFTYALIDPELTNSCLSLNPPKDDQVSAWLGTDDPNQLARLRPFCSTGGDGSYAALWCDELGHTQIVHLGSGSGSVMAGILTKNALNFLRALAIGYQELCWPEQHGMTPIQIHDEEYPPEDYIGMEDEREPPPPVPHALRTWLTGRYDVTIPAVASDVLGPTPSMDDAHSDDPFLTWVRSLQV